MAQRHDHVLQRVGRGPRPIRPGQRGVGVQEIDERRDRRRVRACRARRPSGSPSNGIDGGGGVTTASTLAAYPHDAQRTKLSSPTSSGARNSSEAEPPIAPDIAETITNGSPSRSNSLMYASRWRWYDSLETLVGEVEAVGVLHHELAAAHQAGTRPGLVAVLRLDLVDHERQVAVRAVEVLHHQGEHLLVGRREQHVGAASVLQPEQVRPVLLPPVGDLVGLAGEQRREVDLLEAGGVHLLANDPLDVAVDDPTRAAATRTHPVRPCGRSRPGPATGGSRPRHRRDRRGGFAGTGSTCAARPRL